MDGSWDQKTGWTHSFPAHWLSDSWLNYFYPHGSSEGWGQFTAVFWLGAACTASYTAAPSGEPPGETPFRFQHLRFLNIQKSNEHPQSNWFCYRLPHSGLESQGWDSSPLLTSTQDPAADTKTLGECSHTFRELLTAFSLFCNYPNLLSCF